jgi:hypothetical protein
LLGRREGVRAPGILAGPVPVVMRRRARAQARSQRRDSVGIVETDQPGALRIMQGEGVAQPVRSLRGRGRAPDLELEPVSALEMMNAPVERQQENARVCTSDMVLLLEVSYLHKISLGSAWGNLA